MATIGAVLSAQELVARHEESKLTLWVAIFSRVPLTEEQLTFIVHDDQCSIGHWLLSDASKALWEKSEYKAVLEEQRLFHAEVLEVASLIVAKDFRTAGRAIGEGSSLMECSRRLSQAMLALNRVARMEVPI